MRKQVANIITMFRIVFTLGIVKTISLSKHFFVLYCLAGLTDILDGFVARKLNIISKFGSTLDSIADLIFYTVMMLKILPILISDLPKYVYMGMYVVLAIRIGIYLYGGLFRHTFISSHSISNKITGFLLFLVPFSIKMNVLASYGLLVLVWAFIAAFNELYLLISNKTKY